MVKCMMLLIMEDNVLIKGGKIEQEIIESH